MFYYGNVHYCIYTQKEKENTFSFFFMPFFEKEKQKRMVRIKGKSIRRGKQSMKKRKSAAAFFLAAVMALSYVPCGSVYAQEGTPEQETAKICIDTGVEGVPVKISYDGNEESYTSGADGVAELTGLEGYAAEKFPQREEGDEGDEQEEPAPIVVTYDINLADVSSPEEKDSAGGNGRYEGLTGSFTVADGTQDIIHMAKLSKIAFPKAKVVIKSEAGEKPYSGVKVSNGIRKFVADENGEFETYPVKSGNFVIGETDDVNSVDVTYDEFFSKNGKITAEEKKEASLDKQYTFEAPVSDNGYVNKAGEYTVKAKDGYKVSTSRDGEYNNSVIVNLDNAGTTTPFYVESTSGERYKPVKNSITLDEVAPVIKKISAYETEGSDIRFLDHGIYTNKTADITFVATVTEEESGIGSVTLEGEDGASYEVKVLKQSENSITVAATIEGPLNDTLYLIAKDKAGNVSERMLVREEAGKSALTIETDPPVIKGISYEGENENGWYRSAVSVKAVFEDKNAGLSDAKITANGVVLKEDAFESKIDEETALEGTVTKNIIEDTINADGVYKIVYTAKDNSGNETTKEEYLHIDLVAPNVTLSGVEEGSFNNEVPTLIINNDEKHYGEEGALIHVTIERNGKIESTKDYEKANEATVTSFDKDGDYKVSVFARDAAGNVSEEKTVRFTVDRIAPEFSGIDFTGDGDNGWFRTAVDVLAYAADENSGLAETKVTVNGVEITANTYKERSTEKKEQKGTITQSIIDSTINDKGSYEVVFFAKDKAGNETTVEKTVWIDTVAPEVTLSGIEKDKHYASTPQLTVTNNEKHYSSNGAFIHVKVTRDGQTVQESDYAKENEITVSSFGEDGDYVVEVYAQDAAGNRSTAKNISFVVDKTAPAITITGAEEGRFYNSARIITVLVSERYYKTDNVTITVTKTLDGKETSLTFPWANDGKEASHSMTFAETGTYTITVNATDEAGNRAEQKTLTFTVDVESPEITITGVDNGRAYGYDETFAPVVTFKDSYLDTKSVSYKKFGGSEIATSESGNTYTASDVPKEKERDGLYVITASANDKAGNTTTKNVLFFVNRFGSTFWYDAGTKDVNGDYMKSLDENVVISEMNVQEIKKRDESVRLDGVEADIKPDVQEKKEEDKTTYTYTFDKKDFEDEGVYSIDIVSTDKQNNTVSSREDAGELKFVIDKTAPTADIGDVNEKVFNEEQHEGTVKITDTLSPVSAKVYIDDELIREEDFSETTGTKGQIDYIIPEGYHHNLRVEVMDKAGNSREYSASDITVSKNPFVRIYSHTGAVAGIGAAIVAAGAFAFFMIRKRRREEAEEQ